MRHRTDICLAYDYFWRLPNDNSVIGMTGTAAYSPLRSDFDAFLFATIGDDDNGMLLSVNSALARSGVDPWDKAATLARLPAETATRNLASLIAALPDGPSARPDPGAIAARLIALLPRPAGPEARSRTRLPVLGAVTHSRTVSYIIFFVMYALFMLGNHWFSDDQQGATPVDKASAPASRTPIAQPPPPSPDQ